MFVALNRPALFSVLIGCHILQSAWFDGFHLVRTSEEPLWSMSLHGFLEVEVPSLNQKGHFILFFLVRADFSGFFSLVDSCILLSASVMSSRFPNGTATCVAC